MKDPSRPDFFIGVDAAYDDVEDIKRLVDEVRSYTNLFVIGSTGITENITKLDEVCQYVYESGLYFMIYIHITEDVPQHPQWIEDARQRWGDRFLGIYAYDEAGGNQIDCSPYMPVKEADNYTDAANKFVGEISKYLEHYTDVYISAGDFPLFTSDYALYWFDYKAGYDVVLAEFGWNHSKLLNVALCRGAAEVQNKEWGVIVTWKYNYHPYMESGQELYGDLVLAYQSGAKYVVVFSYPKVSTYGILEEEHLEALKSFWQYVNRNPRIVDPMDSRVAYVLPEDYGYGFRGPDDKTWGLWEDDPLSDQIWKDANTLSEDYALQLDIIYEDGVEHSSMSRYSKLMFWNGTVTTNENQ
ncbi:MAG: hypothetical protein OEY40_00340 [Candidatus Bathyarchaeota archaeon]|nr:hypothetical protein [Candidatus Bathyarchaeota archaeon]